MTLYRTYRPKTFKEVVGRDDIKAILAQQLKTNTLCHAYLFSGTRGTGKTTIARLLAKAANCPNRDAETNEPCNACDSCRAINENRSQDLVEIDAASNRRIEEIRELREMVKYVPASSPYKVYIIDEVHMLTREAFNALLKTLEEPPKHALFVLATTELAKIPDTIFSRCQHFSFGLVPLAEIQTRVRAILAAEKVVMDDAVVTDIARRSAGSLRDAESLLGQILSIGKPEITSADASLFLPKVPFAASMDFLTCLGERDAAGALLVLSGLEEAGANLAFFIQNCLEYSRQLVLYSVTGDEKRLALHFSPDEIAAVTELAKKIGPARLREITSELLRASNDMALAPDMPALALELATVLLCEDAPKRDMPLPSPPGAAVQAEPIKKEQPKTNSAPQQNQAEQPAEPLKQETVATLKAGGVDDEIAASPSTAPRNDKVIPQDSSHSLEDILDGWGEVLAKARDKNHALNFVLGVAEPIGVSAGTLELAFKYRLQQEKVLEIKNREVVETIIKEVYGTSYRIQPTVSDGLQLKNGGSRPAQRSQAVAPAAPDPSSDEMVKAVLQVFEGAEIIQ